MKPSDFNILISRLKRDAERLHTLECVHRDLGEDNVANLLNEIYADIDSAIEFLTSAEDDYDDDDI